MNETRLHRDHQNSERYLALEGSPKERILGPLFFVSFTSLSLEIPFDLLSSQFESGSHIGNLYVNLGTLAVPHSGLRICGKGVLHERPPISTRCSSGYASCRRELCFSFGPMRRILADDADGAVKQEEARKKSL
jgi:hypothetical protein